jgi:hypothetical protein
MRKALVAGAALVALAVPNGWALASASADNSGPSGGDQHSNCHTGSKGRGAGGNDKGEVCGSTVGAPSSPSAPGSPGTPGTPGGGGGAAVGRSVAVATPAAPVVGQPRTTG